MENSFVLIVLLFAALATGGLIVNWIGLGRAMSRLSVSAYVEFHQHTNRTFEPYMPIVVIGALAGGVALAVMYGVHSTPGQLAAAGAVCYALVIVIGVPTCVRGAGIGIVSRYLCEEDIAERRLVPLLTD
jgi:hypothetical protein